MRYRDNGPERTELRIFQWEVRINKEERVAVEELIAEYEIDDQHVYKIADGNFPIGGPGPYILIGCYSDTVRVSVARIFTPDGIIPKYIPRPEDSTQPLSHVAIVHGPIK